VEGEGEVDIGMEVGVEVEMVYGGYLEVGSRLGPDINSFGYGLLFLTYEYSLETSLIRN
jgi:hypothetical protein